MKRGAFQIGGCVMTLCAMDSGGRALAQGTWSQYAGGADRTSTLSVCEFDSASLASPAWIAQYDSLNRTINFVAQQCPMVSRRSAFAIGSVQSGTMRLWRMYSFNRRTGLVEWEAPIPAVVADSWSSVAIDERQRRVIVASGQYVTCFDQQTGGQLWQRQLMLTVVNASPCVTHDRILTNRVFITDYDGFGSGGTLYCINIDQFVPTINPYQPGQIVWTAPLSGASGNTPAYRGERVYVTSPGEYQVSPGAVQAFSVNGGTQVWRTENEIFEGYYGGVGIVHGDGKDYVLATSYGFFGNTLAANTEKIDAESGQRMWSAKSNRSAAIPVSLGNRFILSSGGIQGFGSMPTLQLIYDKSAAALPAWSSLGLSRMGGWSAQPIFDAQNQRIYTGELPTNSGGFGAGIRLHAIDADELVRTGELSEEIYSGSGSSPAIAGRNLYCLGASGLHAYGPTPWNADVNDDGVIDIEDLYNFDMGMWIDVDGDGVIDGADRELLERLVRDSESDAYANSRRQL